MRHARSLQNPVGVRALPLWRHTRPLALILLLGLGGCGDREARAGVSDAAASVSESAGGEPGGPGRVPSADQVGVSISKPPFEGKHDASGDFECFSVDGTWGASYHKEREPGLSAMLLILKGVPATGGTGGELTYSMTFGEPVMDEVDDGWALIDLHGSANGGDAQATVTREGPGAVVRIEGTTHYGARVEALIRCRTVNFM